MVERTPALWAEVRLAYETTNEPVLLIAERFGIPRSTIHNHASRHGWLSRQARRSKWAAPQDRMIARLYRSIDRKLVQLEARMANDDEPSVADHERETRALGQLIRNFEKVADLEGEYPDGVGDGRRPGRGRGDGETPVDPHELRKELATRILRLCEKGGAKA